MIRYVVITFGEQIVETLTPVLLADPSLPTVLPHMTRRAEVGEEGGSDTLDHDSTLQDIPFWLQQPKESPEFFPPLCGMIHQNLSSFTGSNTLRILSLACNKTIFHLSLICIFVF